MQPASPEATRLAQRLRQLREQQWSDARLTQKTLAKAFSAEETLAAATVSSWESGTAPKLPPPHRLRAYARFFATTRSVERLPRCWRGKRSLPEEQSAYEQLEKELLGLRSSVAEDSAEEAIAFSRILAF